MPAAVRGRPDPKEDKPRRLSGSPTTPAPFPASAPDIDPLLLPGPRRAPAGATLVDSRAGLAPRKLRARLQTPAPPLPAFAPLVPRTSAPDIFPADRPPRSG